jgi:hypothetical protein
VGAPVGATRAAPRSKLSIWNGPSFEWSDVRDLEAAYSRLPHNVTNRPIGGWSEERLHHVASFVAAFGGVGSATAHDDGAQFGGDLWRNASQIELHRAAAEADAEHAIKTLTELTRAQQNDQFMRRLAGRTMLVIEGRGADVSDLREVLGIDHIWQAHEDTVIITVRWPSVATE